MSYIYALAHPISKDIRYIGKTDDPQKRYDHHLYTRELSLPLYKSCWIKSLLKEDLFPTMIVVEECSDTDADEREKYWIRQFKNDGFNLTNSTAGGDGGFILTSPEIRRRQSENISKALKGKPKSEEHAEKIRLINVGRKHTEEQKAKIGNSVRGEKNGFFGRHHSEELKKYLSLKFKGVPRNYTEEQKDKMRKTRFSKSGKYWGVHKSFDKWRARIYVNSREIHLGVFRTPEDAAIAYNETIVKYIPDAPLNIVSKDGEKC